MDEYNEKSHKRAVERLDRHIKFARELCDKLIKSRHFESNSYERCLIKMLDKNVVKDAACWYAMDRSKTDL